MHQLKHLNLVKRHFLRLVLLVSLVAVFAPFVSSKAFAQEAPKGLTKGLDQILARPQLKGALVGITVRDASTGKSLFELNGTKPMNPASNMKLLTTYVALDNLAPGLQWETRLEGDLKGDTVKGGLIVKGGADPTLGTGDLYLLAAQLKELGVKKIEGGIVVDLGGFGDGLPPGFDQKNETASYRASISALSLAYNGISVKVIPATKVGEKPTVTTSPYNDSVKIVNEAETLAGRAYAKVRVEDSKGEVKVVVSGKSGQKSGEKTYNLRLDDPTQFAANQLRYALTSLGIEVVGGIKVAPNAPTKPLLASHESYGVATDLYLMNKYSNNFIAEMFFRKLGSLPAGTRPVTSTQGWKSYSEKSAKETYVKSLRSCLGDNVKRVSIKNGSGLYDGNLLSTDEISMLLFCASKKSWYGEFRSSLPIAGLDGSLKNRFKSTSLVGGLYAKTGTLNEVSALSGYMVSKSGKPLIVSVLFNETPKYGWLLRPDQDAIVKLIADSF